ncbi:hypothetical protein NE237_019287 [Protea cynaroides]|uniref:Uncharacterized protein n=1 Tax=Protea cynaroides TaxID=273540 RepID=A0A9Q0QPU8_9MAGN|nr:hypothetical protein NE237_019287 [Protea cynaroides]
MTASNTRTRAWFRSRISLTSNLMNKVVMAWKTKFVLTIISPSEIPCVALTAQSTMHCLINFVEAKVTANDKPVKGVKTSNVIIDAIRNLLVSPLHPNGNHKRDVIPFPVIVFFHDGGFSLLNTDSRGYNEV